MNAAEALEGMPPFSDMDIGSRRFAARLAENLSLRVGKILYYQGDRADTLYLILAGQLRCIMYRSDESTLEMGRSSRGEWLGLAEVLLKAPYLNDVVAEDGCTLAGFSRGRFDRLLEMPAARRFFLVELARLSYALHSRIELNHPSDRLLHFLQGRYEESGVEIACTQEEIAEAVGATRETVNKHLGRLQEQGVIKVSRGSVRVLAPDLLRDH
jgi:CRP-like cAMP-binding protein